MESCCVHSFMSGVFLFNIMLVRISHDVVGCKNFLIRIVMCIPLNEYTAMQPFALKDIWVVSSSGLF